MNKLEYSILLTSVHWQRKRLKILTRDKYTCRKCKSTKNLHVHHKWYIQNAKPWQVPNSYLITLCSNCHKKAHKGRKISSFIRKDVKPFIKRKRK